MSGVAASFDQATGILKLLCETKWTKEEMQRRFFARWGILRDIAVALDDGKLTEEQVRAVLSLLCKKETFQSLLFACQQDRIDRDFNEEHFPLEPVASDEWEVCVHRFEDVITGDQAVTELTNMGYRLCGSRRAMKFIAAHLDSQFGNPLIATVRWQNSIGLWCVPIFGSEGSERFLYLNYLGNKFGPHFVWLVLRKRAA